MTRRERRTFTASFKAKVVLEALKERHTLSELAQKHELHPNQITTWKKEFLGGVEQVFESAPDSEKQALEQKQSELYEQIGRLRVENEWLKKNCCDAAPSTPQADRSGTHTAQAGRA